MLSCPCSSDKEGSGKPLEDLIKGAIAGFSKKDRLGEEEIMGAWECAAGKPAAAHSRPISINKAVLAVNVDGSGWLYELTVKKKEILGKLGGILKSRKIKDIRFRIGEIK